MQEPAPGGGNMETVSSGPGRGAGTVGAMLPGKGCLANTLLTAHLSTNRGP